jgi:hypothetical protein
MRILCRVVRAWAVLRTLCWWRFSDFISKRKRGERNGEIV